MKTDSIKKFLELNNHLYNEIETLVIDRFDIDGSLLNVDFNDLLSFQNLKYLTINKCILDVDFFTIINKINLETLILSNCEIIDDISDIVINLKLKNINIDNTNFNWFNNLYFNSVVLNNIEINKNFMINTNSLDIRKCKISNYDFIYTNIIPKLIISESQYNNYFIDYKGHLIVMEDNGEFIFKEVDNG